MDMPSAANMKFKFSQFARLDDGAIEFALEEATVTCGMLGGTSKWIDDNNHIIAIQYYAAHLLQLAILRAQNPDGRVIISESTPELSRSYAAPQQASAAIDEDLSSTQYGIRFRNLVARNFPAVLTVGSATAM